MIVTVSAGTERLIRRLAAQTGQDAAILAGQYLELALKNETVRAETAIQPEDESDALTQALAALKSRTPEQVAAARRQLYEAAKPPRPMPEGQDIFDVVGGQWPGDETDEEVFTALRKLS